MKKGGGDTQKKPKRVCVVGAGAAGAACAWSLSNHPDKFEVEVWEPAAVAGGVATTEKVTLPGGGGDVELNDGVQGGAPSYRNTLQLLESVRAQTGEALECPPVHMKVCFGEAERFWSNMGIASELVKFHAENGEIERFGKLLHFVNRFEPIFIAIPISKLLRWRGYSKSFGDNMVFPLVALFFGTGNQTPNVPAALLARVFLDPKLRLFDYDANLLLSQTPEMFAMPKLRDMYAGVVKCAEKRGDVSFKFNTAVTEVHRTKGKVTVKGIKYGKGETEEAVTGVFDDIVFACSAEVALLVLQNGSGAGFLERKALRNVRYFNDITVTHTDREYMMKHYELHPERNEMYFVRNYGHDRSKIEMSFDLSHYQPAVASACSLSDDHSSLYQTIFLDDTGKKHWTIDEINPDKIVLRKWWRQFCHTTQHYLGTVPFLRFIQGKRNTYYAGSWTTINTHEIAVISGLAAAYRLGADYTFGKDQLAASQFDLYLSIIHACRRPRDERSFS